MIRHLSRNRFAGDACPPMPRAGRWLRGCRASVQPGEQTTGEGWDDPISIETWSIAFRTSFGLAAPSVILWGVSGSAGSRRVATNQAAHRISLVQARAAGSLRRLESSLASGIRCEHSILPSQYSAQVRLMKPLEEKSPSGFLERGRAATLLPAKLLIAFVDKMVPP